MTYFLNSKTFKRLFGSYIFIIVLCFLAYSGIVIYETVTMKKEQVAQLYDMKLQEMEYAMDNQLTKAENMISSINNSYLIRRFYMSAVQEKSVDAYLLYQLLNELQSQKAAGESFYIYDIALFFQGYGKSYTGGGVISLSDREGISALKPDQPLISLQTANLNELMGMENVELLFYKQFLIYRGLYQYYTGPSRGQICVLFDLDGMGNMMSRLAGEDTGWAVLWNQEPLMLGGREDGIRFQLASRANPQISYEIVADPAAFRLSGSSIWSVALVTGLVVCVCYMILAYVFAYRYYKPWSSLKNLIGAKNASETENEMSRIVVEVKNLVGERDNYKEQIITISPYAEKGILHSMLSGNWDGDNGEMVPLKEYMKLEKMYILTAAISLAFAGEGGGDRDELRKVKRMLKQKAEENSDSTVSILYQDQEAYLGYLVINSDTGEKIEDLLYDYFSDVQREAKRWDYVLTMGVDEVREQLSQLNEGCSRSRQALKGMMTGGRGGIYFYEKHEEDIADYYFPNDGVRCLVKMMKEQDMDGLESFLETLVEKNRREHDLSLTAIQLLEDELYMTTVKAIRSIATMCTLEFQVEKPVHAMTFEEMKAYYRQVYETVCGQMKEQQKEDKQLGQTEQEIFRYVDENYTNGNISLADITEKFHVSNKYVSYIFKKQFGITYLQYVQEKRIAYAVRLLKTTDHTMEKIAGACGYSNLLTFRRNFKSIMSVNPSDFPRR